MIGPNKRYYATNTEEGKACKVGEVTGSHVVLVVRSHRHHLVPVVQIAPQNLHPRWSVAFHDDSRHWILPWLGHCRMSTGLFGCAKIFTEIVD